VPMRARIVMAAEKWGMYPGDVMQRPGWFRWMRESELLEQARQPYPPADELEDDDD
jgi:hypothetical protein